jgi:hypothetical protein
MRGSLALRASEVQRPFCQVNTGGALHKSDDHDKLLSLY